MSIGKIHDLVENWSGNQRLTIKLGADSIWNERADRNIAESDRSLLIHAEIQRNRCARGNRRC